MLKIGITFRITNAETYEEQRDSISHDWPLFLEKINAIPIWIPNSISNLDNFLNEIKLDGIILSGGDNIGDTPIRDATENSIIKYAMNKNMPLLGVCRGMQILNEFFGGTLHTLSNNSHITNDHLIKLKNEFLLKLINNSEISVNSFHKNIITNSSHAEILNPIAISEIDDTVEAFMHQNFPFIGVMWHPERQQKSFDEDILKKIFEKK